MSQATDPSPHTVAAQRLAAGVVAFGALPRSHRIRGVDDELPNQLGGDVALRIEGRIAAACVA